MGGDEREKERKKEGEQLRNGEWKSDVIAGQSGAEGKVRSVGGKNAM
jgi:hypothetical protein